MRSWRSSGRKSSKRGERNINENKIVLQEETEVAVRFNEADPLGIVWHGHYIRYCEDGREAFGKRYGVSYLDFYKQGYAVPVISIQCDYKKPLRYGERVIVSCFYDDTPAAKLKFH